jgi:hypothetical protein
LPSTRLQGRSLISAGGAAGPRSEERANRKESELTLRSCLRSSFSREASSCFRPRAARPPCANTHFHTLSHSLTLTLSHSLSHTLSHSLALTRSHSHTLTLSHSHSLTHTLAHSHTLRERDVSAPGLPAHLAPKGTYVSHERGTLVNGANLVTLRSKKLKHRNLRTRMVLV